MDEKIELIKKVILEVAEKQGVNVDRIILFGSRARGDYKKGSDWDILVVTRERLDNREKMRFWYSIYRRLDFPVDIIVVSRETFERLKDDYGFVYKYALEEGLKI